MRLVPCRITDQFITCRSAHQGSTKGTASVARRHKPPTPCFRRVEIVGGEVGHGLVRELSGSGTCYAAATGDSPAFKV